jgi:hypothetical protein
MPICDGTFFPLVIKLGLGRPSPGRQMEQTRGFLILRWEVNTLIFTATGYHQNTQGRSKRHENEMM